MENKDKCPLCGSLNTGNSPTGYWCNNCGYTDPCECWQGNHTACAEKLKAKGVYMKGCCDGKEG